MEIIIISKIRIMFYYIVCARVTLPSYLKNKANFALLKYLVLKEGFGIVGISERSV